MERIDFKVRKGEGKVGREAGGKGRRKDVYSVAELN